MTVTFAVLGDSIAYGQGASQPTDTIGARLAAELTAAGIPAELQVFAAPRARSDALPGQVAQAVAWPAQVALIIIGANDLTHFVPVEQAAAQLGEAIRALRAAGAQVVAVPTPDLSIVPWVPPQMREFVQGVSDQLRRAQTKVAFAQGARVVDLGRSTSAAFAADAELFSADRFHPSSNGYAVIAAALSPAVTSAAADAPGRFH